MIARILLIALIVAVGFNCKSPCGSGCTDSCKAENNNNKLSNSNLMDSTTKEIACKLTTPELQKRKEEVISQLKNKMIEKQEMPDGYRYRFAATDAMLDELTSFIKTERQCCDFFFFTIAVTEETVWLSITGPGGAKEFIKTEMDL